MMTRRELGIAAAAVVVAWAAMALAQAPAKQDLKSAVFDWNKVAEQAAKYGSKRQFFYGKTTILDLLECHLTTLKPGEATHPPRPQAEEELLIVKEGTVEAQIDGKAVERARARCCSRRPTICTACETRATCRRVIT